MDGWIHSATYCLRNSATNSCVDSARLSRLYNVNGCAHSAASVCGDSSAHGC